MLAFVGAGSTDEGELSSSLQEAVELLTSYLRHLRQLDDAGAVTGAVTAAYDDITSTWTWSDDRTDVELVPLSVLDRATKEVASDLFTRRNAPNGILNMQFSGPEGPASGPARLNRDPLTPAYPLLARWVVPF